MPIFERFRENWVRPALFFGNNPVSLAGGAMTTASGITMVGSWIVEIVGHPIENPYLGIIFSLILPALFILGLLLIPLGMFLRRRRLRTISRHGFGSSANKVGASFLPYQCRRAKIRHGDSPMSLRSTLHPSDWVPRRPRMNRPKSWSDQPRSTAEPGALSLPTINCSSGMRSRNHCAKSGSFFNRWSVR